MAKKDLQYRIDTVQSQSVASTGGSGGSGGGSGLSSSMVGLRDDNLAGITADPYGYIQLVGQDATMEVNRLNTTQMGFRVVPAEIDHNQLKSLITGHPHTQYALRSGAEEITGLWTFNRTTNPPFAVNSGATKVENLNADKLDDLEAADFLSPQYLTLAANGNLTNERVFTPGDGLSAVNAGTNGGTYTLKVGQGTLISVGQDDVGILDGANYQFIGTGSGAAATWRNVSELAGNGLAATLGVLSVNVKEGIQIDADSLRVDKAYDFTWTGTHTFQTNDVQMDVNLDFVGAQSITTTAGNLTINPAGSYLVVGADLEFTNARSITTSAGDLTLNPYTALLIPGTKVVGSTGVMDGETVVFPEFDSSFPIAGWRITETAAQGQSGLTIGAIAADELRVKVFVADETRVDRGDEYWTKSYGILAAPFSTPAIGATATITVEDSPAVTGAVFANNDWVLFRKIDITSGLTVASLWGQVSAYVPNNDDTQSWTYTHRSGPVGMDIKKGDIAIDFGVSGAALIHLSVNDLSGAPFIKMRRWAGDDPFSPANYTTYVQIGNLGSVGNSLYTPQGDGLYIRSTAGAGKFLVADNLGLQIRGADFSLWDGANEVFKIDSTAISLALGANRPTGYAVHDEVGVWMGLDAGAYKFSIGNNDQYLRWDGTNLSLAGSITITNPGDMGWVETFYASTAPGTGGTGDLWFDTDDGNKMYRHSGTDWVEIQDDGIGTALSNAATAQGTANTAVSNAATAQSTANTAITNASNAQTSANSANSLLADIAADTKLTPVEKSSVRQQWDIIAAEKTVNNAQATTFGITTENTTYNTKFQALADYLNAGVAWVSGVPNWIADANLGVTTTIVPATFRTTFQEYYDARTGLLNAVAAKARTLANSAQSTADTAVANAATAQAAADAAAAAAATAISNAATAQSTADGKIETFYATTSPGTGSLGDLWFDTDDGNKLYRHNGTIWVEVQDDGIGAAISAAAGAQATADGKVTTYYALSSSPPSSPSLGDLWYQTDTYLVKRWSGSVWSTVANAYTNTNQLTDGANLGLTASWPQLSSLPARFGDDDDPLVEGLYVTAEHLGFHTGTRWNSYLSSTGTFWLKGNQETLPDENALDAYAYQGLWWDQPNNKLNIYGRIFLNNSPEMGGTNVGGAIYVGDHGLISMGPSGTFQMHDNGTPAPDVGIKFWVDAAGYSHATIGNAAGPGYLEFDGITGDLTLKGKITITDGGDLVEPRYRPTAISISMDIETYQLEPSGTGYRLIPSEPFGFDNLAGTLMMANGERYWLEPFPAVLVTNASRFFTLYIKKYGAISGDGSIQYPGTSQLPGSPVYENVLLIYVKEATDWDNQTVEWKADRIVIADLYTSADFLEVEILTARAESSSTIITPSFIRTPHLEALSIQMGHLQGGKITLTNDVNSLWLNDHTNYIVLAAGNTAAGINNASFKVYENGSFVFGKEADGKYLKWDSATASFLVKGTVNADAGYLNNLTITGQILINDNASHDSGLYLNGGRIYWNNVGGTYNSYLSNYKIHVQDKATGSTLDIGNTSLIEGGLLDMNMYQSGETAWRHGISVKDGGNKLTSNSSLFHGESNINGSPSVNRIFDARSGRAQENDAGSYSDGYYAEMIATSGWSAGFEHDTSGVPFKGVHLEGGVVALFNQQIDNIVGTPSAGSPVVYASSNNTGRKVYVAKLAQADQIAFQVEGGSSGNAIALHADNAGIKNVSYIILKATSNDADMPIPIAGYCTYYHHEIYGLSRKHSNNVVARIT